MSIATALTALNSDVVNARNKIVEMGGSVTPNGGTSQLSADIATIPQGSELPELTDPAEVGHVVAGKEYIDGNGNKRAGTLVVCDTIEEVESLGIAGTGVSVDIESSADGSGKTLTIPEQNLLPENIKNGVSIFGIAGSAKTMRVESGTITLSEDAAKITIPCTDNPKMLVIHLTDAALETVLQNDMVAAMRAHVVGETYGIGSDANPLTRAMTFLQYHTTGGKRSGISAVCTMAPVTITGSSTVKWIAALEYAWTAYYWEDT